MWVRTRRRRGMALAFACVCLARCAPRTAVAEPDHGADVSRALSAVRTLGLHRREALDRDLYEASRTRCHGDTTAPAVPCLIDAARSVCAGDADCLAASDVVVTNLRSTTFFVDDLTRARLVRSSTDYHAALAAELRRRYASLAAELALAGQPTASVPSPSGTAIDAFCRERDRTVHPCAPGQPACVPSLPWSRCVAAIVWFVGGTP